MESEALRKMGIRCLAAAGGASLRRSGEIPSGPAALRFLSCRRVLSSAGMLGTELMSKDGRSTGGRELKAAIYEVWSAVTPASCCPKCFRQHSALSNGVAANVPSVSMTAGRGRKAERREDLAAGKALRTALYRLVGLRRSCSVTSVTSPCR